MSISVNGQSCVPPGFRFHPTEEELLNYYLRKKVASEEIDLDVIRDVDLNKLEPWDIQEKCKIGSGPQNDWYFFSHKDKKYPTGTRTNRATAAGFWKATGRDKAIYNTVRRIGMRKTLVFYKGRAPHGQKSDWIMHEYRLDDVHLAGATAAAAMDATTVTGAGAVAAMSEASQEDGWVVCRVFKKKHHHKEAGGGGGGKHGDGKAAHSLQYSSSDDALDQILQYMGRSCKQEHEAPRGGTPRYLRPIETVLGGHGFMKLPALESPSAVAASLAPSAADHTGGITDWAMMDRLVASHLNGQSEASNQLASCFDDDVVGDDDDAFYSASAGRLLGAGAGPEPCNGNAVGGGDDDLWSFARSASSAAAASERLGHRHVSL